MPLSLLQTVSKMSFPKNIDKKTSKADLILRKKDAVTYTLPNGKIISSEGLPDGLTDESLQKVIEAVEDKEKMKHITRNMVTPIKAGDSVKILQLLSLGMHTFNCSMASIVGLVDTKNVGILNS